MISAPLCVVACMLWNSPSGLCASEWDTEYGGGGDSRRYREKFETFITLDAEGYVVK